jgi:hypothetical protein
VAILWCGCCPIIINIIPSDHGILQFKIMKHVKDGKNKAQQKHTEYKQVMKKEEKNKK